MKIPEERGPTPAVENYAKAIYALERRAGGAVVSTNALAGWMGVTAPSVSAMLKRLQEIGLVERVWYRGVTLTPRGVRVARDVIRRHRLLELFLVRELGFRWDRVHDEAEVLEHVLSGELAERIGDKLGQPTCDPHDDPSSSCVADAGEPRVPHPGASKLGARAASVQALRSDPGMLRHLAAAEVRQANGIEVTR